MNSDFKDLLNTLNAYRVKYLVIGGYAFMKHAEPRYPNIDIWVKADSKNAAKLFKALREFGAPLAGMSVDDFAPEGFYYQLGVAPVRIDILMSMKGVRWDEAWRNQVASDLEGVETSIISKSDLIKAKQAAGRSRDLADVHTLTTPVPGRRERITRTPTTPRKSVS
jgi:hypothetical protein